MWSTSRDQGIGWTLGRTVEPVAKLLDREEAKRHLRILHADDDIYLDALLPAVEDMVERELNRALLQQTCCCTPPQCRCTHCRHTKPCSAYFLPMSLQLNHQS